LRVAELPEVIVVVGVNAPVPVPFRLLELTPDHSDILAWLWENWGTTWALRHIHEISIGDLPDFAIPESQSVNQPSALDFGSLNFGRPIGLRTGHRRQ